jgi:iron complex outermembrane receptor protein
MKWESPKSLDGGAHTLYLAAALLTMAGWASSASAEPADEPKSKNGDSDDVEEVVVHGYRITRGSVGSLVDASVQDIPRNIATVDEEALSNQMVGNTLDILRNFPGVQRGSEAPGAEHPTIRGQLAFQFLEGTYSGGVIWDNAEFLGAAELLTGPNSVAFGFLSRGGGVINYRMKRPAPDANLDVTAQVDNWGTNKYVVDGNLPLWGIEGDGVRVIGIHESITDYKRGAGHGERNAGALMLTKTIFGIKAELDFEILRRDAPANPVIAFSVNPSAPIRNLNPRNSIIQPWENLERDGERVAGKFSRDLTENWRTVVTLSRETQTVLNKGCALYDPDTVTGEGPYYCNFYGFETYTNQSYRVDVLGSFNTFGIKHDVTVGASQLKQPIHLPDTYDNFNAPGYNDQNFYSPRHYPEPFDPTSQAVFNDYRWTTWWTQQYIQDRMQFGEHWDLWVGLNQGSQELKDWDATGPLSQTKDDGKSPSVSLSFAPKKTLRFYVTHADTIAPGGRAPLGPEWVNSGQNFSPLRVKSIEAGVKWQVASISQLNLNVFDQEEPLAYTEVISTDPPRFLYTRAGKNRYRGVEFTSISQFPFGLTLNAGFTLLDPVQEKTGNPDLDGKYTGSVSRQSAALYAVYEFPSLPDLGLTANVTYNSSAPLLQINGFNTGAYTIADLGGFYAHPMGGIDVTYRVNLTNAFDARYLSPYGGGFYAGKPRTLMASFTARFGERNR